MNARSGVLWMASGHSSRHPPAGCIAAAGRTRYADWTGLYTLLGYPSVMKHASESGRLKRLNRIEGQVRGISRMIEEERCCIEIITQIPAARAALRRVEEEVLEEHIAHCVEHAIANGSTGEQREKVAGLMELLERSSR